MIAKDIHFKLIEENEQLYKDIGITDVNAIVILPVCTSSAYSENGFYEYFFDRCDHACTTVKIVENNYLEFFQMVQACFQALSCLFLCVSY